MRVRQAALHRPALGGAVASAAGTTSVEQRRQRRPASRTARRAAGSRRGSAATDGQRASSASSRVRITAPTSGPYERARAAEQHQQQDEDRQVEGDEVGVDVLVLLRDQRTGDAAGDGRDDEGHHLGAVDAHADRRRRRSRRPAATASARPKRPRSRLRSSRCVTAHSAMPNQTHCSVVKRLRRSRSAA